MIIQAELRRKQSEYEGEACSVDKVIELPAQRFKQFSRALLADYDFIAENKNAIRHDEDARHCLLILDADGTDGFLVDPQGYNYARYSAFVPNARSLLTLDKSVYNMSITEYIQRKRISVAEHMLIQTDLTIAEISRIVGYSNPSRLIEIFKRYYGFTPSKYRK